MGRRRWLGAVLAGATLARAGAARGDDVDPVVRLGTLQFGTVQWLAEVIRRHGLDRKHGFVLDTMKLANNDAGRIALMAGSADIVVADWLFAANRRQAGTPLSFVPFSNAAGGIVVGADAPEHGLGDLRGRRLGVAGGPLDRSWLLVQAAGRQAFGIDLVRDARIAYAAPPLLSAKLQQGELEAVLTYWNFAARLEAAGARELVSVGECAHALGLPEQLGLLGFVFHTEWGTGARAALGGFLAAARDARAMLVPAGPDADAEWAALRPVMDVPEGPPGDALFAALRTRFIAGWGENGFAEQERTARQVLDVLLRTGGKEAAGGLASLPDGLFWPEGV